jgi:[glutamine synthetase] adenylyltransferase / [glutamine synthetase]-adenylyl-L-tyrosine phosphorylase
VLVRRFYKDFKRIMDSPDYVDRVVPLSVFLELHGYLYGSRSANNLLALQQFFPVKTLHRITVNSLRTPQPDLALNTFERLSGVIPLENLSAIAVHRKRLCQFTMLCGSSPFLVNLIFKSPETFHWLFLKDGIDLSRTADDMYKALRPQVNLETGFTELMKVLRVFKRSEILRIAARDLNGLASLEEVTAELTNLASVSLQVAYEICRICLISEYGLPMMLDECGQREAEMTVIGMGKLGGYELNFSSDIDIIYFYESDKGETSGIFNGAPTKKGFVSLHTFFVKLGEMISKALSQITEDGFVFRVDVGLRPEGKSGDMAVSLRSAEIYYESWGQSWERTAMIKARPVAGSLELGAQLLTMLQPFVYRKNLDYNLIEDIKIMKQKIDVSLSRSQEKDINLKLGKGGIREIEFFIQALQLVFAGKQPALRELNSLKALNELLRAGLINETDHLKLSTAYRFLRTVEHRIQVVQERQTHNLPTKEDELQALARRSGFISFDGLEKFRAALRTHRVNVSSIFENLFYSRENILQQSLNPEITFLLDPKSDADLVKDLLAERRFENVEKAYDNLLSLRNGPSRSNLTERSRKLLEDVLTFVIQELPESPDPDMALTNLERFFSCLGRRSSYYALLAQNRDTLKLLLSLFGMSEFLSKILIGNPELLESMVARTYASTVKQKDMMEMELNALIQQAEYFEDRLDVLRRYRNEEFLRIGLNDIHGKLGQLEITTQLTLLGETCLATAYQLAIDELKKFGCPQYQGENGLVAANLAIVAMGKMGGGDLNYHSDLDIIFVYDHQGTTDGSMVITNHEYFAKLAQKIISILTMQTREGYVYKIDTRLRPSGNAGPLVTSLDSFLEYHHKLAEIWERQALTKARVVLGEPKLADQLNHAILRTVYSTCITDDGRKEIHRLRMRMENELARESTGSYNIKTGRGGTVDVEFIVQYLQLRYGCCHEELRTNGTFAALKAIRALKLIPDEMAETLYTGFRFLRRLENRLRIIHDHSASGLGGTRSYMNKLALRMGYDPKLRNPGASLISDYEVITSNIRDCYDKVLGEEAV